MQYVFQSQLIQNEIIGQIYLLRHEPKCHFGSLLLYTSTLLLSSTDYCTRPYLIIVTTATTGGGVPFSSRRTFFHREREMDCFYSENKNTENTKQNKKYANQNTKYAKQNTKYAISIKRVRQKKTNMPKIDITCNM